MILKENGSSVKGYSKMHRCVECFVVAFSNGGTLNYSIIFLPSNDKDPPLPPPTHTHTHTHRKQQFISYSIC
jgi:hypothetical protein